MEARAAICRFRWARRHTAIAVVLAFGVVVGQAGATQATAPQTLYVSSTGSNPGTCLETSPCATVSYALTKAASGAIIKVSGTVEDNISISSPVTVTTWPGGPAGSPGILNGAGGQVVVNNAAGVTIEDLTIEGGGANDRGGGIYNTDKGTMTLTDSTLTANSGSGGGILTNVGSMTVTDSTISANTGGPAVLNDSTLTIIASTISSNADGGIYSGSNSAVAVLAATIVADNTGYNCDDTNGSTRYKSAGYNLTNDASGAACSFTSAHDKVNKNPQLGPLAANGGPTKTMLPKTSSPAADVIPNATTLDGFKVCPSTDQRGVARPGTGETRCTIGAVEVSLSSPMATASQVTAVPAKVTAGERVAFLIVVTPKSGTGTPTGSVAFTIGSTKLCKAVLSGGDAACGATNAPVGTDTVRGTYSGGGGYAGSSGTTTLTVNKASDPQR